MWIIFFILFLTALSGVIWSPISDNGQIIIEWLDYHLEISVILVTLSLLCLCFLAFYLTYFFIFLKNIPSSLKKYYQEKQDHDDLITIINGFSAIYREDLAEAKTIIKKLKAIQNHQQSQLLAPVALILNAQYYENKVGKDEEPILDESYKDLLKFEETKFIGLKGLINLRMKQKLYQEAAIYAEKAYELKPKTTWLLKALIEIYTILGKHEKAEQMIKKSASYDFIDKNEEQNLLLNSYVSNANYYITHQQEESAIAFLEKALKIDPAFDKALYPLARILAQESNKKAAHKLIEKAWKKSPSLALAKFLLSIFHEYPVNKKMVLLKDLISSTPNSREGYLALAEFYTLEDMLPQARETMDKLLSLYAPDSQISKLMALIEAKAQNNHTVIINWLNKL